MMKAFFSFFVFFAFSVAVQAAILTPADQNNIKIEEGKIFEGLLKLEANENLDENDWNILNNDEFSDVFFFIEANRISKDEYKLRLLLKKFHQTGEITKIKLGQKEINLRMIQFQVAAAQNLPKDFIIQDQKEGLARFFNEQTLYVFLFVLLVASYPSFKFGRQIYLKNKIKKERILRKDFWRSYFYSAQTRTEFEEIGRRRKEWLELLKEKSEMIGIYFDVLEKYQYKKDWDMNELQELKQSLNGIKDVFDRFGI